MYAICAGIGFDLSYPDKIALTYLIQHTGQIQVISWWRHQFTDHRWIPLIKASDAELWCFVWSAPQPAVGQTLETPVIWDAILLIMMFYAWLTGRGQFIRAHQHISSHESREAFAIARVPSLGIPPQLVLDLLLGPQRTQEDCHWEGPVGVGTPQNVHVSLVGDLKLKL